MDISIKEEERIRDFFSLFDEEELAYIANWAIQEYEMPDKKPSEGQSRTDFLIDLFKSLGEDYSWYNAEDLISIGWMMPSSRISRSISFLSLSR